MNQPSRPKLRIVSGKDDKQIRCWRGRQQPIALKHSVASLSIVVVAFGGAVLFDTLDTTGVDTINLSSISEAEGSRSVSGSEFSIRTMPVCGLGKRSNCIVDGDTFWLDDTKFRIANIDTPELKGRCNAEQITAKIARQRLKELINDRPVRIRVTGTDRYGRKLAIISDAKGDIGDRLVGEGLAEVWDGESIDWCRG